MDLLHDKVKKIYSKYLFSAFFSALVSSIYSIVDLACVGQYQGPDGTAALGVIAPLWNVIYSLGLLMGIGGSVLFSNIRGKGNVKAKEDNQYFTASFYGSLILALLAWLPLIFFERELLTFCGAKEEILLSLAHEYLKPIRFTFPLFLFNQALAAFLRNDNDPILASVAVLAGGLFNAVGDYLFTFTFNMGLFGAGLATALGGLFTFLTLIIHFFKKKNTLRIVKTSHLFQKWISIIKYGFSSFFIDIAMGILTILFNRQIGRYLDNDTLAIYSTIININTIVQCCAYSVGQASQPIISTNYGAKKANRIRKTLKYALITSLIFGVFWLSLSMADPNLYIRIFMKPTDAILKKAPSVIRTYSLSFLLLPINIFSTYYFQSIMKAKTAFLISLTRGLLLSGLLILTLPLLSPSLLFYSMPITEVIIFLFVIVLIYKDTKALPNRGNLEWIDALD